MAGEADLDRLLAAMDARLDPQRFVFVTLPSGVAAPTELDVAVSVREDAGLTLVVPTPQAEAQGLAGEFPCAWITLRVHSSLDAVGFLAVVTTALARVEISTNAVAGFHHDHLFVPWERRDEAMAVLRDLAARAG